MHRDEFCRQQKTKTIVYTYWYELQNWFTKLRDFAKKTVEHCKNWGTGNSH